MGLLQRLKSVLGLERDRQADAAPEPSTAQSAGVTVEREPSTDSEPATETEDAVNGTDTADEPTATAGSTADDETVGVAAESVEESTDESAGTEDPADLDPAEVDDSAEDEGAGESADTAEESGEPAAETDDADAEPGDAAGGSAAPVTEIKGIGPAYGERLEGAGVDTVGDLADADAESLGAEIDVSEKRVGEWIERAQSF